MRISCSQLAELKRSEPDSAADRYAFQHLAACKRHRSQRDSAPISSSLESTEAGEMGVADLVGQDGNNRIAADFGASPNDFAVRIGHNPASGRPRRANQCCLG
jgi:hypothetical protein